MSIQIINVYRKGQREKKERKKELQIKDVLMVVKKKDEKKTDLK